MTKHRDPAYDKEWDRFMLTIVRERGRICEYAEHIGNRQLGILQVVYGDHVVELRDGGTRLDNSTMFNLTAQNVMAAKRIKNGNGDE